LKCVNCESVVKFANADISNEKTDKICHFKSKVSQVKVYLLEVTSAP